MSVVKHCCVDVLNTFMEYLVDFFRCYRFDMFGMMCRLFCWQDSGSKPPRDAWLRRWRCCRFHAAILHWRSRCIRTRARSSSEGKRWSDNSFQWDKTGKSFHSVNMQWLGRLLKYISKDQTCVWSKQPDRLNYVTELITSVRFVCVPVFLAFVWEMAWC